MPGATAAGGRSEQKPVDEEVVKLALRFKADAEHQLGRELPFYEPITYETQVVAGLNFFIVIRISPFGWGKIEVQIFEDLKQQFHFIHAKILLGIPEGPGPVQPQHPPYGPGPVIGGGSGVPQGPGPVQQHPPHGPGPVSTHGVPQGPGPVEQHPPHSSGQHPPQGPGPVQPQHPPHGPGPVEHRPPFGIGPVVFPTPWKDVTKEVIQLTESLKGDIEARMGRTFKMFKPVEYSTLTTFHDIRFTVVVEVGEFTYFIHAAPHTMKFFIEVVFAEHNPPSKPHLISAQDLYSGLPALGSTPPN